MADVDAFLDTLSPEQFDELFAADIIDNPPGREEREVMTACMTYNASLNVLAAHGAKIEQSQFLDPHDFLPHLERPQKPAMSSQEMKSFLKSRFGGG